MTDDQCLIAWFITRRSSICTHVRERIKYHGQCEPNNALPWEITIDAMRIRACIYLTMNDTPQAATYRMTVSQSPIQRRDEGTSVKHDSISIIDFVR